MKRFTVLLILTFGISVYSFGQLRGGFKGGFNYSDLLITTTVDSLDNSVFGAKPGYNIGCFVNVPFSLNLGMQVEVLLSNKGYKNKSGDIAQNVNLNYISWPIMFYYRPTEKLDLEVGPEFGLLITANDLIKSFDMGINVGIRYYVSDLLDIAFRYNMGMPETFKDRKSYEENIPGTYANSTFQLTFGFSIFGEKQESSSAQ